MGGNALNIDTRRYNKKEYDAMAADLSLLLMHYKIKHFITKSYKDKEDFGDIDVLISSKSFESNNDMYNFIVENFDTKEISRNKSVISFEYRDFQIDFIRMDQKYWETAKVYYSYNDLGNLMGRIAANMGFRYGHFGLRYQYNSIHGGKTLKIDISRDPEKIFAFLGFNYALFESGFNSLEDIFKYVVFSKYFTTMIFQYSMLNHQNKTRNKKRVNYGKFLDYIGDKNNIMPINYDFPLIDYIGEAENFFGVEIKTKVKEFDLEIFDSKRNNKAVEKFNGNIILNHFDITGKEIGKAITKFKREVEDEFEMDWETFVLSNREDTVMRFFCKYNNLYNKTKKEWLKY